MSEEVVSEKQLALKISSALMGKVLGRILHGNSPGLDLVQGHWLKKFDSLHGKMREQLQDGKDLPLDSMVLLLQVPSCMSTDSRYFFALVYHHIFS